MTTTPCWNCRQPATHTLTRPGSDTLHACDACTRIDRESAERLGWAIVKLGEQGGIAPEPADAFTPGQRVVCGDGRERTVTGMTHRRGEPARVVVEGGAAWIAEDCRAAEAEPDDGKCVLSDSPGHPCPNPVVGTRYATAGALPGCAHHLEQPAEPGDAGTGHGTYEYWSGQ